MLLTAGFDAAHVWLRPMLSTGGAIAASSQRQRDVEHVGNGSRRRGRRDGRQRKADRRGEAVDRDDSEYEEAVDIDGEGDEEEADFKEWTCNLSFSAEERSRHQHGLDSIHCWSCTSFCCPQYRIDRI